MFDSAEAENPAEADPLPLPEPELRDASARRDRELMLRVAQGDERAFAELLSHYQNSVHLVIARMLFNSGADVEDLAQQVFIRVWKYAKRYDPQARFSSWLYTITRNLVYNESRRIGRKKTVLQSQKETDSHWQPMDQSPLSQPDEKLQHYEFALAVDNAIAALPEQQRLAVLLRKHENMAYEDIAVALELSVSAVKSLLFRARAQLKQELGALLDR